MWDRPELEISYVCSANKLHSETVKFTAVSELGRFRMGKDAIGMNTARMTAKRKYPFWLRIQLMRRADGSTKKNAVEPNSVFAFVHALERIEKKTNPFQSRVN